MNPIRLSLLLPLALALGLPGLRGDSLTIEGDLVTTGSLGIGATAADQVAIEVSYEENGSTYHQTVTADRAAVEFLWRQNGGGAPASKMALGADNSLKLFDAAGVARITLKPAEGEISLSGSGGLRLADGTLLSGASSLRSSALYNSSGQAVASVDAEGRVNFANGLSMGSGANASTLTPNGALFLTQTLTNLGFRETTVAATPVRTIAISGNITITAVTQDVASVYVIGRVSGYSTIGGAGLSANINSSAAFVAKLTQAGTAQWVRIIDGGYVGLTSVAVDGGGNVVVAGYFSGTTSGLDSPAANLVSSGDNQDAMVVKYNAAGQSQWAQRVGGTNLDRFTSVTVDGSGNVIGAGFFFGATTGLSSPAANLISNGNSQEAMVVKYNAAGQSQWAQRVGRASFTSVAVSGGGNVVAVGSFSGTTTGLSSPAANLVSSGNGQDALVVQYNAAGQSQWAQRVGGPPSDCFNAVAVDGNGNVVAVGSFSGTTTGLSSPAANLVSNGNGQDALVVQYNAAGQSQWAQRVGGTAWDSFTSVAVGGSGNVVAAGHFYRATTGLSSPATNLTGLEDWQNGMIVAYDGNGQSQSAFRLGSQGVSISGLSLLGSSLWSVGYVGGVAAPIGTTRVVGHFAAGWNNLPLVTPPELVAATLAWGGSSAQSHGVALGSAAFAAGEGSVALGTGTANAAYAFASGSSRATANSAVALGNGGTASGYGATAMGNYSIASGSGATAIGNENVASGDSATAMGFWATASGNSATAMGEGSSASGYSATAMGVYTVASGSGSTAMGEGSYASGHYSVAMGLYTTAQAYASTAVGRLNVPQGDQSQWVPTDDLFVVGNGDWDAPSNAFAVRKSGEAYITGNLGVGTNTPTARLDISGDAKISGTLTVGGQAVATADQLSAYQSATGSGAGLTNIQASAIIASGTRSATTFLRGDNTWAEPPSDLSVIDGNKGDITVSNNGAVWTVNNGLFDRANHTGTQDWSTITGAPSTAAAYGITDVVTKAADGAVTLPGATTAHADMTVKNRAVIRVSPAGDIDMGGFTVGTNPEL